MITENKLRYYPALLAFIGILIHLSALYGHPIGEATLLNHVLMFIVDVVVFWGLIYRTSWGYWCAVILFLQQSIFQTK